MIKKINKKAKILISIGSVLLFVGLMLVAGPFIFPVEDVGLETRYGITYSAIYAEELGIDTVGGYEAMVSELGFDLARIPVYWNRIEARKGEFDWTEVDELMAISSSNDVDVIMAIGRRVPRWPECFLPEWLDADDQAVLEEAQLKMMREVVNRYKDHPALVRWQVENEPYFTLFGECPKLDREFLKSEFELVRSLDDNTPLQTTASGEQSLWYPAARLAKDYVGISVYRTTYTPFLGYSTYPMKPWMYRARVGLVGETKLVVSELQMEPWFARPIDQYSSEEMLEIFNVDDFDKHIKYTEATGFKEVSLWGTEWWYFMKEKGHPEIWDASKALFLKDDKIEI